MSKGTEWTKAPGFLKLKNDKSNLISIEIDKIREEFKIPKEFKETFYIFEPRQIDEFAKRNMDNLEYLYVEKSRIDDEKEKNHCYFYNGDDFKIYADCGFDMETQPFAFAYVKDKEVFEKEFFSKIEYIEKGCYNLVDTTRGYVFDKIEVEETEMPILNDDFEKKILDDINGFFSNKKFYEDNKLLYKRGLLLWGGVGLGKTSLIKHLLSKLKDKYGIILNCNKGLDSSATKFLDVFLKEEPRILVLEDIDGIESYNRSTLLNMLDGVETLKNTLVIATTNSPEKLDIGITNRPGRFDRIYNIAEPNNKSRERLLLKYFPDLKGKNLENCVKLSKGFSGAYFKELFIIKNIQNVTIEKAIENIKEQLQFKEKISTKENIMG